MTLAADDPEAQARITAFQQGIAGGLAKVSGFEKRTGKRENFSIVDHCGDNRGYIMGRRYSNAA